MYVQYFSTPELQLHFPERLRQGTLLPPKIEALPPHGSSFANIVFPTERFRKSDTCVYIRVHTLLPPGKHRAEKGLRHTWLDVLFTVHATKLFLFFNFFSRQFNEFGVLKSASKARNHKTQ